MRSTRTPNVQPVPAGTNGPIRDQRLHEILVLMAEGLSNAEIGHRLGLRPDTVKTYAKRLFKELGACSRANAVYLAAGRPTLTLTRADGTDTLAAA